MAYTAFHVFGDSLVDSGNALKLAQWYGDLTATDLPDGAPTAELGYFQGRFTNGYNFADLIGNKVVAAPTKAVFPYGFEDPWFDLPIAPWASKPTGTSLNWAYGGAQIRRGSEAVSPLDGQTDAFRRYANSDADSNALYMITIGGNDVRSLVPSSGNPASQEVATDMLQKAAATFYTEVRQLIDIGVHNIVITGVPDVGMIPRYDEDGDGEIDLLEAGRRETATAYSAQLDGYLRQQIALLEQYAAQHNLPVNIQYVSLVQATGENLPSLASIWGMDAVDPIRDGELLFFDQIHPNAQAHALLASSIIDQMNGVSHASNERLPMTAAQYDYRSGGTIGVKGEVDKILVSLAAGTTYTFEMLGISSAPLGTLPNQMAGILADPTLRILGPSGAVVGSNDDGGMGLDANWSFTATTSGTYTIELRAVGSLTGSYTFQAGGTDINSNTYTVNAAGTVILEGVEGGGGDWVKASVSYALNAGAEVEKLTTTNDRGKTSINLTGNEFDQEIWGNVGANVLDGLGGNDLLKGGSGKDKFAFTTALGAGNVDRILDFSVRDDTITLDDAVFAGLSVGTLTSGAFAKGRAATQSDDRIIYDPASGKLYFDADGVGGVDQVQFATLSLNLAVTAADFIVN